jgi:undecaprenyl-diphosphatase
MLVTAGVLAADMLALLLKMAGGRRRPFLADPEQDPLVGTPLDLSLPSGHAATSFAGATLLAWYAPRFAVPLYALAVLVAWSRVYVGVHYPLDILAGAALGFVVGVVFRALERHRPRSRSPGPS